MKKLIISALVVCGMATAHADKDRGGGSGTAAEITRATDAFIQIVEKYPHLFPQVDSSALKAQNPQILVTASGINLCNGLGRLEAFSDIDKNLSVFSYGAWVKKSWIEKVQLAGHERLVLAGQEDSNKYSLSNKIYDARIQDLISSYGKPQDACALSAVACKNAGEIELSIARIAEGFRNGDFSQAGAERLLKNTEANVESTILLVVGLKKMELEKRTMVQNRAKALATYQDTVRLAFESQFRPMFEEARSLIEASASEANGQCVELE